MSKIEEIEYKIVYDFFSEDFFKLIIKNKEITELLNYMFYMYIKTKQYDKSIIIFDNIYKKNTNTELINKLNYLNNIDNQTDINTIKNTI